MKKDKDNEDKYVILYDSDQKDRERKELTIFMWIVIVLFVALFSLLIFAPK